MLTNAAFAECLLAFLCCMQVIDARCRMQVYAACGISCCILLLHADAGIISLMQQIQEVHPVKVAVNLAIRLYWLQCEKSIFMLLIALACRSACILYCMHMLPLEFISNCNLYVLRTKYRNRSLLASCCLPAASGLVQYSSNQKVTCNQSKTLEYKFYWFS